MVLAINVAAPVAAQRIEIPARPHEQCSPAYDEVAANAECEKSIPLE
jgi:hypothetical protein